MSSPTLVSPLTRPRRDLRRTPVADPPARTRPRRPGLGAPAAAALPAVTTRPVPVPVAAAPVARTRPHRRTGRRVAVVAAAVLGGLGLGVPLIAAADVVATAGTDVRTPTDAIVVLGASSYWGDPSPVLQARLQHALELHAAGVAPVIVTVGSGRPDDPTTEADQARAWLLSRGVPADAVVSVPDGRDTVDSLRTVQRVVTDLGWDGVTLVSDPAHMARAAAVASSLGLRANVSPTSSGPGSGLTAEYVARETVSLLGYQLRGRWAEPPAVQVVASG